MLLQLVVLSLGFSYLWAALPSGLLGFRSDRALFTGRWVVPVVLMTQWYGCEIVCEDVGVWWAPIHIQMYNVCTCACLVFTGSGSWEDPVRQGPVQMCKGTSSRTRQQPHSEELHHWVGERGRPSRPEVCHYSTRASTRRHVCVWVGGEGKGRGARVERVERLLSAS